MLSKEQVEQNKIEFLKLIAEINISGADTQGLVDFLDKGDFFTAPASTVYHCNFEGGLCYHSLNVYKTLIKLANEYVPGKYGADTLLVVGLLHDISKTNFYEKYMVNKKIYNDKGSKSDNMGKFDWFSEEAYKVKDVEDRFIGGEHGFNSLMLVNQYIPLNYEESIAILNHHCGVGEATQVRDLSAILNKYPLATLLHIADFTATFVLER